MSTSIGSIIQKNVDTSPQSPNSLSGFAHDINKRYEILKQAKNDPNSKPRKWLAKRQIQRARESLGEDAVGRHPQTGEPVYKTCASARDGTEWDPAGSVKKADGYVRTIYDLIDLNYNFMPSAMGKGGVGVNKADDPLLTDTHGVHNEVYGSDVFALLNSEQNMFGLLETRPWTKSGERIITEFAAGGTSVDGSGGVGENAQLPDTQKPVFDLYETEPNTIVHTFDVSQVEQLLAATDDDSIADDPFALLRSWFGDGISDQQQGGGEHPKQINQMLCNPADTDAADTLSMTGVDRVISNSEESSLLTDPSNNDVYGFDRSAGEFEANVIHNDGNQQIFHVDILDDMIREVKENSDKNPQMNPGDFVFVTGHDTYQRIEDEYAGKERVDTTRVSTGVNGISTEPGEDVGPAVQSYKDIPIVEVNDIAKDDLSRVYLIDTSTLWIKMLLPTQFYSTGTEVGDGPFPLGRLGNEGAFVTIGELTCKNPVTHAKARDLA